MCLKVSVKHCMVSVHKCVLKEFNPVICLNIYLRIQRSWPWEKLYENCNENWAYIIGQCNVIHYAFFDTMSLIIDVTTNHLQNLKQKNTNTKNASLPHHPGQDVFEKEIRKKRNLFAETTWKAPVKKTASSVMSNSS